MTPILWVSMHDGIDARGYWDQDLLECLFRGDLGPIGVDFEHFEVRLDETGVFPTPGGAIVVLPARHHTSAEDVAALNLAFSKMPWVILILTGDEDQEFPILDVEHPNIRFWVMSPKPENPYPPQTVFIGSGWAKEGRNLLNFAREGLEGPHDLHSGFDWFFSGQVTNVRREECVEALRGLDNGLLRETAGFGAGLEYVVYLMNLLISKVAPCPSGPFTQDTFRAFEALEAGCIPILDGTRPDGEGKGYWDLIFSPGFEQPVLSASWSGAPGIIEAFADDLRLRNRCFSRWQLYKRMLRHRLHEQLDQLAHEETRIADRVTFLVASSPIASHPDTSMLEETIASLRDQRPSAEIIIMLDGVRPEQEHLREQYETYVNRVLHLCNSEWWNIVPLVFDEHRHQSGMTRRALRMVATPTVAFIEHDTPMIGTIAWERALSVVESGMLNVLRFHHEASIPWEHDHLMLDAGPVDIMDLPVRRTAQWSQRPHLARTEFYRMLMDTYFTASSACMIEDTLHGACEMAANDNAEWARWRVGIFSPEGSLVRSRHLDGRGTDPKYPMTFDYPGETPDGAPRPGTREM